MKTKLFLSALIGAVGVLPLTAQQATVVINQKLLEQLTKNQAVRLASNTSFLNSYKKQNELYDKVNQKMVQIVAIQDFIYNQLRNIDAAITQGKQLLYFAQYLGEIAHNASKMLSLSAGKPQYAILHTETYNNIIKESTLLEQELTQQILHTDSNFLVDPYDRSLMINKALDRARIINGFIMYVNFLLENAKNTPYIYQIPGLNGYVNLDKSIVQDILMKYKYFKY